MACIREVEASGRGGGSLHAASEEPAAAEKSRYRCFGWTFAAGLLARRSGCLSAFSERFVNRLTYSGFKFCSRIIVQPLSYSGSVSPRLEPTEPNGGSFKLDWTWSLATIGRGLIVMAGNSDGQSGEYLFQNSLSKSRRKEIVIGNLVSVQFLANRAATPIT
jgi:hypothetical protein